MSVIDNEATPSAEVSDAVGITENIHFDTSRREMFIKTLGVASVLSASQMLDGMKAAHAEEVNSPKSRIDPSLLSALQFAQEQSRNTGAVFLFDNGLLIGFADNLYHHDLTTDISKLLSNGQLLLSAFTTEDAPDNVDPLIVGTGGTLTSVIKDRFDNLIRATMTIEAINDLPPDFLVTGQTNSDAFTGSTYKITLSLSTKQGSIGTLKTTYNVLNRSFPLGVDISCGPLATQNAAFDPKATSLMPIAAQIFMTKLGVYTDILLTNLQQDFSFRKLLRKIAIAVAVTAISIGVFSLVAPLAGGAAVVSPWLAAGLIVAGVVLLIATGPHSFEDLGALAHPAG